MSEHQQFAEDLALYALGSLQGDELRALELHLQDCVQCRRELEELRGDIALLALSSAGAASPQRARKRLLDAAAREPRRDPAPKRRPWWVPIPLLAAVLLAFVTVLLWQENAGLKRQVQSLQGEAAQQLQELERARNMVATLTATDALRVTLVPAKSHPQPQGKVIYVRDRSSLIFLASNLPSVPSQKAYELWLIPTQGAPIPAGVFKPDAKGSATVVNPPLPVGVEAKAFAITVEPEGGSNAPTSTPFLVGEGK